jgi:hypothetical protein
MEMVYMAFQRFQKSSKEYEHYIEANEKGENWRAVKKVKTNLFQYPRNRTFFMSMKNEVKVYGWIMRKNVNILNYCEYCPSNSFLRLK